MAGQGRPDATILLTRPRAASERFLAALEDRLGHRVSAVISPVLEIEPVETLPDLSPSDTLIVTAPNAIEALGGGGALRHRRVRTVGARTAAVAADAGAEAECLGETVNDFVANAGAPEDWGHAVHLRGVHSRGELAARLTAQGIPTDEAVIYDQRACPLSRAAQALLAGPAPVVLPLFSPRSARLTAQAIPEGACLSVVAISAATAEGYDRSDGVAIAGSPTADAMLTAVVAAFQTPNLGGTGAAH